MRVEDDGTGMRREAVEAIGSGERYGQFNIEKEGRKEDVELELTVLFSLSPPSNLLRNPQAPPRHLRTPR